MYYTNKWNFWEVNEQENSEFLRPSYVSHVQLSNKKSRRVCVRASVAHEPLVLEQRCEQHTHLLMSRDWQLLDTNSASSSGSADLE